MLYSSTVYYFEVKALCPFMNMFAAAVEAISIKWCASAKLTTSLNARSVIRWKPAKKYRFSLQLRPVVGTAPAPARAARPTAGLVERNDCACVSGMIKAAVFGQVFPVRKRQGHHESAQ